MVWLKWIFFPQPNASGGLNVGGDKLTATGQDDMLNLLLDVDNIVASAAGVPGLFGVSADVAGVSLGYDIINFQMGPTIDLQQDFELEPTLMVELVFDQLVEIGGQLVSSIQTAWNELPDITFFAPTTMVTPTFFLQANLLNQTLLDFDLEMFLDLLQITLDHDLLPDPIQIGIGNILSLGIDLFDSPNLYEKLFSLQGFNIQIGDSFAINLGSDSILPSSLIALSADNPIVLREISATEEIPVPATVLLLILGLGLIVLRRPARISVNPTGSLLRLAA